MSRSGKRAVGLDDEELLGVLRRAAVEARESPLSMERYDAWRAVVSGPVPAAATIAGRFEGWHAAWARAGFSTGGSSRTFSREDVRDAVAACAVELGFVPRPVDYSAWASGGGERPGMSLVRRHWRDWAGALEAAGLDSDGMRPVRRPAPPSRERVVAAVREWVTSVPAGRPLLLASYARWTAGRPQRPDARVVARVLGTAGWQQALLAAGVDPAGRPATPVHDRELRLRLAREAVRRWLDDGPLAGGAEIPSARVAVELRSGAYERWRTGQRPPLPPTRHSVAALLGSWTEVLEAAGVRAWPWDGVLRRGRPDREAIIVALRACATELDPGRRLTMRAYDRWRECHPERRLPQRGVVKNRFGSWSAALVAAGVPGGMLPAREQPPRMGAVEAIVSYQSQTGDRRPTMRRYLEWQARHATAAPSVREIVAEHGSWNAALSAAAERAVRVGSPPVWENDELLDALRRWAAQTDPDTARDRGAYDGWRRVHADQLPIGSVIAQRFGGWRDALEIADLEPPDQRIVFDPYGPHAVDGALQAFAAWAPIDRRSSSRYLEWRGIEQPDAPSTPTVVRYCGRNWADVRRRIARLLGEDPRPPDAPRGLSDEMRTALQAAAEARGRGALGRKGYTRWRREHQPGAPHPLAIVAAAGSWDDAVAAVGIRPASSSGGARWERHELLQALHEAARSLPHGQVLTTTAYEQWRREDPHGRPHPILIATRLGDGWIMALGTAGLPVPEEGSSTLAISRTVLTTALRDAAEDLGRPPRRQEYDAWARDQPDQRPLAQTIAGRHGGWDAGLRAAGLDPSRQPPKRVRQPDVSTDEARAALCAWLADHDESAPRTKAAYQAWRARQVADLPTWSTIARRHGNWTRALATIDQT